MAAVTQGDIARREDERLSSSDLGIVLYRQLLENQIEQVERGHDPMNVHRSAPRSGIIVQPSPTQVAQDALATLSARQQKRARHRQHELLRGSATMGDGPASTNTLSIPNGPLRPGTSHYEVVIRPTTPAAA